MRDSQGDRWTEADVPAQRGRTAVITGANTGLGFETARVEIDARLGAGRRVFLYNMVPSRWTLEGLNAPERNPNRDRYDTRDFEALLSELRARYDLVPIVTYWEESKEPLYLFGRRVEPLFELRKRS